MKKVVFIAHMNHVFKNGKYYSYEPFVRELELWSELFDEIVLYVTVVSNENVTWAIKEIPANCKVSKIYYSSGYSKFHAVLRLLQMPLLILKCIYGFMKFDLIHLRAPGHPTIISNVLNRFWNKKTIIKWATSFDDMYGQRKTVVLERNLLKNLPSRSRLLLYSDTKVPGAISFFPALISSKQLKEIEGFDRTKFDTNTIKFYSVGRLHYAKNLSLAFQSFSVLKEQGVLNWEFHIIGDGPERKKLEEEAKELDINEFVTFYGSLSFDEMLSTISKLHFLVFPSPQEGWGKVINEAWATGCLPLVVKDGNAKYPVVKSGGAGFLFENNVHDLTNVLTKAIKISKNDFWSCVDRGAAFNHTMTLEKFQEGIKEIIAELDNVK